MNIQDALKALQPDKAEHWTADGMPRVDVVAELTDNPELTRADITASNPEFTREKSLMAQAEALDDAESPKTDPPVKADEASTGGVSGPQEVMEQPDEAEEAEESEQPDEAPQEAMEQPDEAEVATEPEVALSTLGQLHKELETSTVEMYKDQGIAKEAKTKADAAADQVNALNRKIEVLQKADPHHDTAHIRAYLAQQRLNRLARAGRMQKFLGGSGVALKDVAKELDPRAPLDRAMHGRKAPRGTTRPVYIRGRA